jgi:flagellar biosynthesis GTPase FlhF
LLCYINKFATYLVVNVPDNTALTVALVHELEDEHGISREFTIVNLSETASRMIPRPLEEGKRLYIGADVLDDHYAWQGVTLNKKEADELRANVIAAMVKELQQEKPDLTSPRIKEIIGAEGRRLRDLQKAAEEEREKQEAAKRRKERADYLNRSRAELDNVLAKERERSPEYVSVVEELLALGVKAAFISMCKRITHALRQF